MSPINLSKLHAFRGLMGSEAFKALVDEASTRLALELDRLGDPRTDTDWAALTDASHRLRGSLGSLGCDNLVERLDELEAMLREGRGLSPAPAQIEAIRRQVQQCIVALKAFGRRD